MGSRSPALGAGCAYLWSGGEPVLLLFPTLDSEKVEVKADDDNTGTANVNVVVTVDGTTCQAQLPVTVIKPTGETTSPDGWNPSALTEARFMMQIEPADACYSQVSVKEYGDMTDTCYFEGSQYEERISTLNSVWYVDENGGYGPDLVSWSPLQISFYRSAASLGGVSGTQIMKIVRPAPLADHEYERHFIEAKFDLFTITSSRDGRTLTKDY